MIRLFRCFILALMCCLLSGPATSQVHGDGRVHAIKRDSSPISSLRFDDGKLKLYSKQKAFIYKDIALSTELNSWDRFWAWFWRKIGEGLLNVSTNLFSRYIFIGIGVAVICIVLIKIIGAENIFSKKAQLLDLNYVIPEDDIHGISYDQEIEKLIAQGDYRTAVRLLYLRCLKRLNDAGVIHWQPDKTNYAYLSEISQNDLKQKFSDLTLQFDYIWYGDFPVDKTGFEPIHLSFNHFNTLVK